MRTVETKNGSATDTILVSVVQRLLWSDTIAAVKVLFIQDLLQRFFACTSIVLVAESRYVEKGGRDQKVHHGTKLG